VFGKCPPSGHQAFVRLHRLSKWEVVEVVALAAAVIGFGIAFPPWGYVAVASVWIVFILWRLRRFHD
jgi:hypothetical protein